MSRRTSESNKAILAAWNKEQELVREGKGTREWTPKQQQDILDKGKAYDEDGVAFQGQHMKSAEMYPEYQGDPENIQFLTRNEHLEAHDGNWRNPTNWYFNPITKEKTDFGNGKFIPCEIIQLAEPVVNIQIEKDIVGKVVQEFVDEASKQAQQNINRTLTHVDVSPKNKSIGNVSKQGIGQKLINGVKILGKTIVEFPEKYPTAMKVIKGVGVFVATVTAVVVAESPRGDNGFSNSGYGRSRGLDCDEYEELYNDYSTDEKTSESSDRSLPDEHTVRGHGQRYHYKDGSVKWKEKDPYSRGG